MINSYFFGQRNHLSTTSFLGEGIGTAEVNLILA